MSKKAARLIVVSLAIASLIIAAIEILFVSNRKETDFYSQSQAKDSPSKIGIGFLNRHSIDQLSDENPVIPYVTTWDSNQDGRLDILACDGRSNAIRLFQQMENGSWKESQLGQSIRGPVHVTPTDIDNDGDDDLLVASMGIILPNRERVGSAVLMVNNGNLQFENHALLSNTDRVTDARAADLDGDGDLDVILGQFGYDQGAIRWLEQIAPLKFQSHDILLRSGTINTIPDDVDADGDIDILALVSQEWEEVYCFFNDGKGQFTSKILWASTNQDYGSSGLTLVDLDQDGDNDLLYSNGDGFDYASAGYRPWHSVQWLENRGKGEFVRVPIGSMTGAYSPTATDIDQDGDIDIIASSACNDWGQPTAFSLVCFENMGNLSFKPRPLALSPTHIVSIAAADLDGDGYQEIVSGGFHVYPPWNDMSSILVWDN